MYVAHFYGLSIATMANFKLLMCCPCGVVKKCMQLTQRAFKEMGSGGPVSSQFEKKTDKKISSQTIYQNQLCSHCISFLGLP